MDNLLSLQMSQAVDSARAGQAPQLGAGRTEAEAQTAAEDFEAFLLSQMVTAMFAGTGENNPFGGGPGEQAFRGLLNEEYAKAMAQSGGLGLSDRLTAEILQYQEASRASSQA